MSFINDIIYRNVHEAQISAIKDMAMRCARIEGAVSLCWGLPSFRTPAYIREGVKRLLDEDIDAGKYSLPDGLPQLRELVAAIHTAETGIETNAERNVIISAGNMQALNTLFHTILDPDDEVILTDPCFASHIQQIQLFNGTPVFWPLNESRNWSLDIDLLPELINKKTQAIVIVSPSNPTGKIFTKQELMRVGEIAKQHDILVIIDDPYSAFLYEHKDKYFNLACCSEFKDHVVYQYSFSKSYAMSGWRLNYMILPADLKREALKVHDATLICAPRISQLAGIIALSEPSDHKREFETVLANRRRLIKQRLDNLPDFFSYHEPEGAYYVFPKILAKHKDSHQFAIDLLENSKVATTPGRAFGPSGEHHLRMAYCVDEDTINIAFDRIEAYLK